MTVLSQTYLVVWVETESLCCFNCVTTPWSASVQTVVLTCTGFGEVNSESQRLITLDPVLADTFWYRTKALIVIVSTN